jgi:hypothetical protein
MSTEDRAVLKSQLYAAALLGSGSRWALLARPPKELMAFVEGFDVFISEALPSFALVCNSLSTTSTLVRI